MSRRTAVEVDEKHPLQMFVVDQGGVGAGTGLVVDGEVTHVWVPPEQVVFLLVNDQFLCGHVHVNASQTENTSLMTRTQPLNSHLQEAELHLVCVDTVMINGGLV